MKISIKSLLFASLSAGMLTGCVNGDHYPKADTPCYTLTPTKSVADIFTVATATPTQIATDDIIEAYVVSSDEGGTFYKTVSLETLDKSRGFSIPVDMYNIYTEFEPGRKVYVNLKDRYIAIAHSSLVIGDLYQGTSVGRLVPEEFRRTAKASCDFVNEDELVSHMTIAEALNNNHINKLIEFDNVQFADAAIGSTYYDANSSATIGGATNWKITDNTGHEIIFRTSEFAKFAGKAVPNKSGKIRGVLTKYNSDFQFLARTERDIMLENPRFYISTAQGGTNISFTGSFTEDFTSYAVNLTAFPKYVNDQTVGGRYWQLKQFPANTGNKYIEMTSFGSGGVTAKTYFFVPVDFTAANTFAFKTLARFYQGNVLKVYYVTAANYTAGGPINLSNFVDITSSFSISTPATGQSASTFQSSGVYTLPGSLTGNGYFVFEHSGTPTITTTMQIDDITVN